MNHGSVVGYEEAEVYDAGGRVDRLGVCSGLEWRGAG